MSHEEEYFVALATLHGARIWDGGFPISLDKTKAQWFVFEPGWDENTSFSLEHCRCGLTRKEAVFKYCIWKELLSVDDPNITDLPL